MPVPRLFEAASETAEQWAHVVGSLLAVGGPRTASALLHEIVGEDLPGSDQPYVRERRRLGDGPEVDVLVRDRDRRWAVAIVAGLAFDALDAGALTAVAEALADQGERTITVALTPDRRPSDAVAEAAAGGHDVRQRSWLRVRDWVQERPERGRAEGAEMLVLREAEYFLTPRVAELYRLEGPMKLVPAGVRAALAEAFFDLNELAPAPRIDRDRRIAFPRSGDPKVEIVLEDGLSLRIAADQPGPGFTDAGEGWASLAVADPSDYLAARSWVRAAARDLLPARL